MARPRGLLTAKRLALQVGIASAADVSPGAAGLDSNPKAFKSASGHPKTQTTLHGGRVVYIWRARRDSNP